MNTHGGDIYRLLRSGFRYEEILDFSASINPLGMPSSAKEAIRDFISISVHYPDPQQRNLRNTIGRYLDIDPDMILAGNGSTELIYLTLRALRPERVFIPVPTFSEYERASRCAGVEVFYLFGLQRDDNFDLLPKRFIELLEEKSEPGDVAFICNPNNPTGRLIRREDLLEIADFAMKKGIILIVDEAFIDFVPDHSIVKDVEGNPSLIVLRSMTKFYGLAGLRLGYGVFAPGLLKRIIPYKEPWTVNILAEVAGSQALQDRAFKEETHQKIKEWKTYLETLFKKEGIEFIPSSANFYLFYLNSWDVTAKLAEKGILIRDCSDFMGLKKGWFRIAVRRPEECEILFKEIKEILR